MKILFEILTTIVIIFAIFQKQKWKMMLFYTFANLLSVFMYFAFGRIASAVILIIAALRTAIFCFYAYKNIKPNIFWLCFFEIAFVVSTILTWQDAFDLMPLIALLFVGYGSWQDNSMILRICYAINQTLYVIYKAIIGAYISMTVEVFCLTTTIICLIYYCILKKETPILKVIFKKKKNEIHE